MSTHGHSHFLGCALELGEAAPGLGVKQASQHSFSTVLVMSQIRHFQDPGLGLNISKRDGSFSAKLK